MPVANRGLGRDSLLEMYQSWWWRAGILIGGRANVRILWPNNSWFWPFWMIPWRFQGFWILCGVDLDFLTINELSMKPFFGNHTTKMTWTKLKRGCKTRRRNQYLKHPQAIICSVCLDWDSFTRCVIGILYQPFNHHFMEDTIWAMLKILVPSS